MPTLSQRLGSFPSESRAEIFMYCRKDCPLPPPINKGGFYGLREEKIRSKNHKKPASPCFHFPSFPISLLQLSLYLSTAAFSGEDTNKPSLYTTTNTSSTIGSQHNHQAATTTLSLFSFRAFSLFCKLLFPAQ